MESYLGVVSPGTAEIVEKKSRFLGYVYSVQDEEEAMAHVEALRKEHYDARHHCYAYSIGTEGVPKLKASDDGEPQGTAGKPMLDLIQGREVKNILVVVVRYFGGTLLGTGGLVRAYTQAAKAAMDAAEIRPFRSMTECKITVAYPELGKLEYLIGNTDAEITDKAYDSAVTLTLSVYTPEYDTFAAKVRDLSGGQLEPERLREYFG